MKCLILAAGYATRLYPLTENFPKPLLQVGEKSILDWLVDDLVETTDIDEFVVISNHKFAQHFENWKENKAKTRSYEITVIDDGTSTNETRLGAVKDIQLAVETLNLSDDLLVMAGDNVLDFSLSSFVAFMREKGTSCVMCHEESELRKQQKTAIITVDSEDLITSYLNMPDCIPTRYEVEMNTAERELYDMLKQDLLIPLKDGDIDAANAASLTGKLLQMSNGAVYDENGHARSIHKHKLEALEDLIEAANGQSVLVA